MTTCVPRGVFERLTPPYPALSSFFCKNSSISVRLMDSLIKRLTMLIYCSPWAAFSSSTISTCVVVSYFGLALPCARGV